MRLLLPPTCQPSIERSELGANATAARTGIMSMGSHTGLHAERAFKNRRGERELFTSRIERQSEPRSYRSGPCFSPRLRVPQAMTRPAAETPKDPHAGF